MLNSIMDFNVNDLIESVASTHKISLTEIKDALSSCFKSTWENTYGEGYDIVVKFSNDKLEMFRRMTKVKEVLDFKTEIEGEPEGEEVLEKLDISSFSRHAISSFYHNFQKEIRKIHKKREFELFEPKVGELIQCQVKKIYDRVIILKIQNEYTGVIPNNLKIKSDKFLPGDHIFCRLQEVKESFTEHQLIFERKSHDFIKLLMNHHIPEVASGNVEIMNMVRIPGNITKVLLNSDGAINAVGACLGMKGQRIKRIINDIKGEKIDFIKYHPDPIEQLREYFRKKQIDILYAFKVEDNKYDIVVSDEKFLEAVGRGAQNVNLGKILFQININLIKLSEFESLQTEQMDIIINNMMKFGINKEQASDLVQNYNYFEDALKDDKYDKDLKTKLQKYIDSENQKEKEKYMDQGGYGDFFLSIPNIPTYVYFKLLKCNIKSSEDIKNMSAEDIAYNTELDKDICIILKQFFSQNK